MDFKKILNKVRYSKPINSGRELFKKITLPGLEGMSLYEGIKFTVEAFLRSDIATKSAAISFKLFISLFPALLLLLSLIPYVPIDDFQNELLDGVRAILPNNVGGIINKTIEDLIFKKHTGFLSVGFILTIYYSSAIINSILTTLSKSYQVEIKRNPIKQRLVSLVLMIAITIMMIIGFALILFSENVISYLISSYIIESDFVSVGIGLLKWIAVLFLFIISISTIYNTALLKRKEWKIVSSGATWATLLITLASMGMSFYIDNFDAYNKLYGSIGSLIVFLIWINISTTILILGFELHARNNTKSSSNEDS